MRIPEDGSAGGAKACASSFAEPLGSVLGEVRAEAPASPLVLPQDAVAPSIAPAALVRRSRPAAVNIRRTGGAGGWRRLNWRLILSLLLNGLAWWGILALLSGP